MVKYTYNPLNAEIDSKKGAIRSYVRGLNHFLFNNAPDPGVPPDIDPAICPPKYGIEVSTQAPSRLRKLEKNLKVIADRHRNLIENIIVHGSYGDFTEIAYSDLDLIVILYRGVLDERKQRYELQRVAKKKIMPLIYNIDPLQHHGFFVMWDELRLMYLDDLLPLCVFDKSWGLKNEAYEFRVCQDETPGRSLALLDNIIHENHRLKHSCNFFHLKRYISHILILPSVWMTSQGYSVRKPDSFQPFMNEFPEMEAVIIKASVIRDKWPTAPLWLKGINRSGVPYRILGNRWPKLCGLLYPRDGLFNIAESIELSALLSLRERLD